MQKYILLQGNASNLVQTSWAMMGLIHAGQVQTFSSYIYIYFSSSTNEVLLKHVVSSAVIFATGR